jgi:hypothetical protein
MLLVGCKKSAPVPQSVAPQSVTQTAVNPSVSSQPSQSTPAQPKMTAIEPRYGWKKYDDETFTIGPSQGRFFVVPKNATRLRVDISANSPVLAGVMNKADIKNKGVVSAPHFNTLPCAFVKAASGDRQCALDPRISDVFVLRDERENSTQPRQPNVIENKIKVVLSAWACVANCKPLVGDGR